MENKIEHTQMCKRCGKKIRKFKTKFDWKHRKMHKKCWKDWLIYSDLETRLSGLSGKYHVLHNEE